MGGWVRSRARTWRAVHHSGYFMTPRPNSLAYCRHSKRPSAFFNNAAVDLTPIDFACGKKTIRSTLVPPPILTSLEQQSSPEVSASVTLVSSTLLPRLSLSRLDFPYRPKNPTDITSSSTTPRNKAIDKMAEAAGAAQGPPTFKLVLVGDGGTGKVRSPLRFVSNTRVLRTVTLAV